jgi:hypothetical protein
MFVHKIWNRAITLLRTTMGLGLCAHAKAGQHQLLSDKTRCITGAYQLIGVLPDPLRSGKAQPSFQHSEQHVDSKVLQRFKCSLDHHSSERNMHYSRTLFTRRPTPLTFQTLEAQYTNTSIMGICITLYHEAAIRYFVNILTGRRLPTIPGRKTPMSRYGGVASVLTCVGYFSHRHSIAY